MPPPSLSIGCERARRDVSLPFAVLGVERETIAAMMAKGTYAGIVLATGDLDATFARLQARGAEVVQEPVDQAYGVRDCAFRDPAGNMIRIQELR